MLFKKKVDSNVYSPSTGTYKKLADVADTTFSSGLMGEGLAIDPGESIIKSPITGEVTMVFPTKHAIGLKRKDGLEVLLHIGIETVNLNGKGFKTFVNVKDVVTSGDALLEFDKDMIKNEGLDPVVIMIFTNGNKYALSLEELSGVIHHGEVVAYAK